MLKFYKCPHCGNLIAMIKDSTVVPVCCGDQMMELKAGVSDGAFEKHVPVFTIDGCTVKVNVGEVNHPMTAAHLIEWIAIETNQGCALKHLTDEDTPDSEFALSTDEKLVRVYAYCNLHGLWQKDAV
jgi:superoxide reductase